MFYSSLYICIYFKIIYLCVFCYLSRSLPPVLCILDLHFFTRLFSYVHCILLLLLLLACFRSPFTLSINFLRIISKYMYIIIKYYIGRPSVRLSSMKTRHTAHKHITKNVTFALLLTIFTCTVFVCRHHRRSHSLSLILFVCMLCFDLLFFLLLFICNFKYIILIFGASALGLQFCASAPVFSFPCNQ